MRKNSRNWRAQATKAEDAIAHVNSGMKVFVHGAAATPTPLLDAICRRQDLENISLYHLRLAGDVPLVGSGNLGGPFPAYLFASPAMRKPIQEGRADFLPMFLADIPELFASGAVQLDAALVQLPPRPLGILHPGHIGRHG